MLKILGLIGLLISFSASADFYQWTDKDGHKHFSESLPKDLSTAKDIHLRSEATLPGITNVEPPEYIPPAPHHQRGSATRTGSDNCTTSENAVAGNIYAGDSEWKRCHYMH